MIRTIFTVVALVAAFQASAQESADYAKMGRAAWAAFECSSLADKPNEQERLFHFGYEQGKKFIDAVQAKRITPEDLDSIVPSGVLMLAQGPTPDFILGRVFESAQHNALKDVITSDSVLDKDLRQTLASRKYTAANCEILGSGR